MPRLVAFVGPHNSGKTGLVARIGAMATKAGWTVGIIKRAAQPLQFDRHGKDSARFIESGARQVISTAPGMLFVQERQEAAPELDKLTRRFGRHIQVWLVESYTPEPVPWIRVARKGQASPPLDSHCMATVGVRDVASTVPAFRLDRPRALFDFLHGFWQGAQLHAD